MQKFALILSALILAGALGLWAAGGFHPGWTQTQIPVTGTDPITGIEYTRYEDGFVAGLDVVVAGAGLAGVIAAGGLIAGRLRGKPGRGAKQ